MNKKPDRALAVKTPPVLAGAVPGLWDSESVRAVVRDELKRALAEKPLFSHDTPFLDVTDRVMAEAGWSVKPETLERLRLHAANIRAKNAADQAGAAAVAQSPGD